MPFACLRAAKVHPLFGVVCSAVRTVLVGVADAVAVGTVPCVGLDRVSHQRVWRASGGVFSRPSVFPRDAHARQHGPMKNRGGAKKKDGSTVTGRA